MLLIDSHGQISSNHKLISQSEPTIFYDITMESRLMNQYPSGSFTTAVLHSDIIFPWQLKWQRNLPSRTQEVLTNHNGKPERTYRWTRLRDPHRREYALNRFEIKTWGYGDQKRFFYQPLGPGGPIAPTDPGIPSLPDKPSSPSRPGSPGGPCGPISPGGPMPP